MLALLGTQWVLSKYYVRVFLLIVFRTSGTERLKVEFGVST